MTVHLTALIGDYDLTQTIPLLWLLHVGIFVVWLPTVLKLNEIKKTEFKDQLTVNPSAFLRAVFKDSPTWLTVIGGAGFFYAVINFALFMSSQPGVPDIMNGQHVLQNHGQCSNPLIG